MFGYIFVMLNIKAKCNNNKCNIILDSIIKSINVWNEFKNASVMINNILLLIITDAYFNL